MKYYECTFTFKSEISTLSGEEIEIINDVLASELGETGFDSFVPTTDGLNAYIPESLYDETKIKAKLQTFPVEGITFNFETNPVEDKNWNEEWERNYFQPVIIGNDCIIHATFHNLPPEIDYTYNIIIDPKMSFGTGNHETTLLMLTTLLSLDLSGKNILDMGCGTGVLSILSIMKNASRVVAVDIDEWAYQNTIENAALNNTPLEIHLGDAALLPALGNFDIILANINRNILLNDISRYTSVLSPDGIFLASGFYTEDLPAIIQECSDNGITYISHSERNNWVAVKAIKG